MLSRVAQTLTVIRDGDQSEFVSTHSTHGDQKQGKASTDRRPTREWKLTQLHRLVWLLRLLVLPPWHRDEPALQRHLLGRLSRVRCGRFCHRRHLLRRSWRRRRRGEEVAQVHLCLNVSLSRKGRTRFRVAAAHPAAARARGMSCSPRVSVVGFDVTGMWRGSRRLARQGLKQVAPEGIEVGRRVLGQLARGALAEGSERSPVEVRRDLKLHVERELRRPIGSHGR